MRRGSAAPLRNRLPTEEGEGSVALFEDTDAAQGVDFGGQFEGVAMLGDDEGVRSEKFGSGESVQNPKVVVGVGVGRIEKDVREDGLILAASGKRGKTANSVIRQNGCARANVKQLEILANERGRGRVIFDEDGFGGPTAEGFDADSAGAGKDVEEMRAGDFWAEHVEERFAELVAGWAKSESFERFQLAGAVLAGDDAHEESLRARRAEGQDRAKCWLRPPWPLATVRVCLAI